MKRAWRIVADALWWLAKRAEDRAAPRLVVYPWTRCGFRLDPETGRLKWFSEKVYPEEVFK